MFEQMQEGEKIHRQDDATYAKCAVCTMDESGEHDGKLKSKATS